MTEQIEHERRDAWIQSPLRWLGVLTVALALPVAVAGRWAPLSPITGPAAELIIEGIVMMLVVPCFVALSAARWVNRSDWWMLAGLASWFGVVFVAFILPAGPGSAADDIAVTFPPGWKR